MNKNIFCKFFDSNILFFLIFSFIFISVYNSFMFIGIIEDGHHHFWEAITSINPLVGHEGFNNFPFNSRLFPNFLSHSITSFISKYNFCNIKILLYIFTFVSYITPLLFLILIYFNLPKKHKNIFEFITLYFLICLNFMSYQIWTENLLTGLFIYGLFTIYNYSDFTNLSKVNLVSLPLFSVFIISSHPMVTIFIPILLLISIEKYIKGKNINLVTKIILLSSFVLLIYAFFFNCYYIINPIFLENSYFKFSIFFNYKYILFFLSIFLIIILSILKLNKNITKPISITLLTLLFLISIFNFPPNLSFNFRTIGLYIPLLFLFFLLFLYIRNISINYNLIHILNILIIMIIIINTIYYGSNWNNYIKELNTKIQNSHSLELNDIAKFDLAHNHAFAFIFIYVYYCFNNNNDVVLHIKKTNNWLSKHIETQIIDKRNIPKYMNIQKLINLED